MLSRVGQAQGAASGGDAIKGLDLGRLLLQHDTELAVLICQVGGESKRLRQGARNGQSSLLLELLPAVHKLGGELRGQLGDDDVAVTLGHVVNLRHHAAA
ncbi:hypothetical protein D3C78_1779590 [compost metagenome]